MNDIDAQYRRIMRLRKELSGSNVGRNNEFNIAVRYLRNMLNALGKSFGVGQITKEDRERQFSRRTYMGLSNG